MNTISKSTKGRFYDTFYCDFYMKRATENATTAYIHSLENITNN